MVANPGFSFWVGHWVMFKPSGSEGARVVGCLCLFSTRFSRGAPSSTMPLAITSLIVVKCAGTVDLKLDGHSSHYASIHHCSQSLTHSTIAYLVADLLLAMSPSDLMGRGDRQHLQDRLHE